MNSRPQSKIYPTATPADFGESVIVKVGDYVVNHNGDIMIATTSNAGPHYNEFLRQLNEPFFRAQYIGNSGDSLEHATRCRLATREEIARAKMYQPSDLQMVGSQLVLL